MQLKEHSSSESTLKGLSSPLRPDGLWLVSGDSNIAERRGRDAKNGGRRRSGMAAAADSVTRSPG